MLGKILIFGLIITFIYFFIIKKPKKKNFDENEFLECKQCGVFYSCKDMIISSGKYVCKECFNANHRS